MEIGNKIKGAIAIVVVTVVLLYMTPVIVDAVDAINTTGWDFTGYEGAIAILGLVPFLWVAGVLAFAAAAMFVLAKSEG
jgi:hypothetical protein